MNDQAALAEAVRRLVAALHPEKIYLFGSQARDEGGYDSDYDIMVIVRRSPKPRYERAQAAYRALVGVGIPLDVLVFTRTEFDSELSVVASLPATIAREGRLLYAA